MAVDPARALQRSIDIARLDVPTFEEVERALVEEVGPVDLRQSEEHPFLGREIAQPRTFSESTAHQVDDAVRRLLQEAEERAAQVIRRHKAPMERLIEELEEKETLGRAEIEAILGPAQGGRLGRPAEVA